MDHCILRPLYPLFSPCQWSLTAPRTISDVEDEDEEESGENRRRARSCSGSTKRESEGIIQELPRDHPTEACHGSPPSSPRLASVVTRRECAITALRTRWRWRGSQAHVGLRLSSWQFTVFARSLARSFAIRTCGTRDRFADLTHDSSSVFLSRRSCNSRASLSLFFLTFRVPSVRGHVLSSPRWYLFLVFHTHLSLCLSRGREIPSGGLPRSKLSIYRTWFTSVPSQCRE